MPCLYESLEGKPCQNSFPEEELYDFVGKKWCVFHLPMTDKQGNESSKTKLSKVEVVNFNTGVQKIIIDAKERGGKANLSGFIIPKRIDFRHIEEFPEVNFEDAVFYGNADFSGLIFQKPTSFGNAHFVGSVDFSKVAFRSDVIFEDVTFDEIAEFSKAQFHFNSFQKTIFKNDNTRFVESIFYEVAQFDKAQFKQTVRFSEAKFVADAKFIGAHFGDIADFGGCEFNDSLTFSCSTFDGPASFDDISLWDKSRPLGRQELLPFKFVSFSNVTFNSKISFINRNFGTRTDFKGCVFSLAPQFHGCQLHQFTTFPTIEGFKDTLSEHAPQAYRTLKLAMENVRARQEESMFYALEQQSLRNTGKMGRWEYTLSWLYEKIADYGQSSKKPLAYLTIVTVLFFIIYALWGSPSYNIRNGLDINFIGSTIGFSIKQLVNPLDIWRTATPNIPWTTSVPTIVKIVTTVQAIISTVFLTLFILAIRWRFRRG